MNPSIYTRPAGKPSTMRVRRRQDVDTKIPERREPITVHVGTECHVTPPNVGAFMVNCLQAEPGMSILEPEAGTGNLVHELIEDGVSIADILAVERSYELCEVLRGRYPSLPVEPECFLEYSANTDRVFDRIIMNPPFKKVRQHIAAAEWLLAEGGILVALVPITFKHDSAELVGTLDVDTFALAKVHTKIISIQG